MCICGAAAEASAASAPSRGVERSTVSTSGLYRVLKPIRSPFADGALQEWQGPSNPSVALPAEAPQAAQPGSPEQPGRVRRRISRKISACKYDPLSLEIYSSSVCTAIRAVFMTSASIDLVRLRRKASREQASIAST